MNQKGLLDVFIHISLLWAEMRVALKKIDPANQVQLHDKAV